MKIRRIIMTLPVVAVLCSCQSEAPQIDTTPQRVLTVRASLSESDTRSEIAFDNTDFNTRAQITYGNTDRSKEIFMWNLNDEICVFNISRLNECPLGLDMICSKINGRTAEFTIPIKEEEESTDSSNDEENADTPKDGESAETPKEDGETTETPNFKIKKGDWIFVNYSSIERKYNSDGSIDSDKFSINVNPSENKPQLIFKNPTNSSLEYMKENLKMYGIVQAVRDDEIPDIHFKHLSTILRVTFHNRTGEYFLPKTLQFKFPGSQSFFANSLVFSVDPTSFDGSGLMIYEDASTYSNNIASSINNYTAAPTEKGDTIRSGETYDLYLSCVPKIYKESDKEIESEIATESETETDKKLIICLEKRLSSETSQTYEMTLNNFNATIEAGKRYWFNLTAVNKEDGTGKLMLTSEWEALNNQQGGQNTGSDQNSSGD